MPNHQERPTTILIAALGGEGGGVLTNWIVTAATRLGYAVQSTSIPGVAQRTGATTYYIEIVPETEGKRPVLALSPGAGDIDLVVASELLEAGRTILGGFVTPDRTKVIASTSRSYIVTEKMAMADGRYDPARLMQAVEEHAQGKLLFDMEAVAKASGAMINAVMLGAMAGCGRLPLPIEALEAAIRADGKAVEANLRGFRAGLDAARGGSAIFAAQADKRLRGAHIMDRLAQDVAAMPSAARDIVAEGVRRLITYQDQNYARLYLDRLAPIVPADERAGAGGRLVREAARHLALRMSYEDVIRVAQAKIDPARLARIEESLRLPPGAPHSVSEFLNPGIEELCSLLPPRLARRILALSERRGWLERAHWPMEVKTTSVGGYLRFRLLAKLRRRRPRTFRYQEEQAAIEQWLALVTDAAQISPELALEVAECARLIKGYSDTLRRGTQNYRTIVERVIRPALAGHMDARLAADAIASARAASLRDPDGEALARCLADLDAQRSFAVAAE